MCRSIHRISAWILAISLLILSGFGEALHMLPGMGHVCEVHGEAHLFAGSKNDSVRHHHRHDEHRSHSFQAVGSRCQHSEPCTKPKFRTTENSSDSRSSSLANNDECGLCKLLASLKQITPVSIEFIYHSGIYRRSTSIDRRLFCHGFAPIRRSRAPPFYV